MMKRNILMTTAVYAADKGGATATAEKVAAEPKAPPVAETTQGQEVAPRTTGTGVAVYSEEDAGAGLENVTVDELTIPFVKTVQPTSRILKESEPQFYNPTAKAGMLYKHTTMDLFEGREKGLIMIPCAREHYYTESTPFDQGGGFHGIRQPSDPLVTQLRQVQGKFGKLKTSDGHELGETFNVYAIFITPDDYVFRAILPFASTQIPKYKTFIEIANGFEFLNAAGEPRKHAMYAHKWVVTTTPEKTKKGDIYGLKLRLFGDAKPIDKAEELVRKGARLLPDDPLYAMGRDFNKMIEAGKAKVDYAEAAGGKTGDGVDDDIPF